MNPSNPVNEKVMAFCDWEAYLAVRTRDLTVSELRNTTPFGLVQPNAAALIESLRAFGYSTKTAVADLIDNSISAGARNVWVTFFWDGADSYVAICDDGSGTNAAVLRNVMRPGNRNPLEKRGRTSRARMGRDARPSGDRSLALSEAKRRRAGPREEEEAASLKWRKRLGARACAVNIYAPKSTVPCGWS
jgi:hypothetical protein